MFLPIKSLTLKRFRSVPAGKVYFDNPTFLVGQNGAGKSNVVDALSFISDAMTLPLHAVFLRRGGIETVRNRTTARGYPPHLGLRIDFGKLTQGVAAAYYSFEVRALADHGFEVNREQCRVVMTDDRVHWFDRTSSSFDSNVQGLSPAIDSKSLGLPVVGGHVSFAPVLHTLSGVKVYAIHPLALRKMQDADSGTSLKSDGSNAASVLLELQQQRPEDVDRICEILATIVPHTVKVQTVKHSNKLELEFVQSWNASKKLKFPPGSMSDGTLRALGLLMAVYQQTRPTLLAIEEPEATMHPGALGAILDLLRHASRRMQVVVTTHSPELLDEKWIHENHLRLVTWTDGATRVSMIGDAARNALQQHLMGAGELLRSNALRPADLFEDVQQLALFDM